MIKESTKQKLWAYYRTHGIDCLCTYCGQRDFCICDVRSLNAECYRCAIKRLEREQRGSKLDVEDFCKL